MSEELLKAMQDKIDLLKAELAKGFATNEQLKAFETEKTSLKAEINLVKEIAVKNENTEIAKQLTDLTASFVELQKSVVKFEEKTEVNGFMKNLKDGYENLVKGFKDKSSASMTIKSLPLTTGVNFIDASISPFKQPDYEAGTAKAPEPSTMFIDDVPTGSAMGQKGDIWNWTEEGAIVDNTKMTAEGVVFGTIEPSWAKKETRVKKITNYTKASKESFEDWDEFAELINDVCLRKQNQKLNTQLLSGDGTGENLKGILSYAVAFNAFGIVETNANKMDALLAAISQIMVNGQGEWYPDNIYLHPSDVTQMRIEKTTTGEYLTPSFLLPNGMQVDSIPIKKSTKITQGYFGVFTMSLTRKRFKRELTINVYNQNSDDAEKDLVTIATSQRVAFRIRDIESAAFVYDSFDAAVAIMKGAATSLAMIQAMAVSNDASKLTINLLIKAGITGTNAEKLPDYKVDIAAEATIADLAALQVIISAA